jgi:glyoxylase-like metal-dependent hydrolase (beta-lactamase superfamily II)
VLDKETITWINSLGGLVAIVISHPHYYSTHNLWAETFGCPVYISREDEEWTSRKDTKGLRKFIEPGVTEVSIPGKEGKDTGVKAIKLGGHFPGSLVTLVEKKLLIADTLLTTPGGLGDWKEKGRPKGMNSFAFMWSIPNVSFLKSDLFLCLQPPSEDSTGT